jgi:hypothetical protein
MPVPAFNLRLDEENNGPHSTRYLDSVANRLSPDLAIQFAWGLLS